jgi:hypothetical protein
MRAEVWVVMVIDCLAEKQVKENNNIYQSYRGVAA